VIGLITRCLVDMVVVMGDVFALVYKFHMPLSLKVRTVRLVELVAIDFKSLFACVLVCWLSVRVSMWLLCGECYENIYTYRS
jgi:hypothetical protein